ncbi:T9SS type B sorting domain-containing protein [Galbibacter pacificus]|uniref:T9SS type B sorting domain-containing protein n=1 Tax=Galbibacter pacificus TaxID=2996052 RepID=A0ABT6FX09_9FLAO|nr:T9SS type B sorting domain-containing protein [Galbibacter pacificus]MDG3584172.1 T9SS type B sorting domain-containing protein [Galbibacter pacificus]MDG3587647.1 T9SS type B sorting domain-containing protein [Galbibacter pacificus]
MKQNYFTLKSYLLIACIFFAGIFALSAQVKNNFDVRYQDNIRGELTFIANNIVNRDSNYRDPEDPYDATGSSSSYNDDLNMQYIDIDNDGSTFSSSSAILSVPDPNCSRIVYAGLYWSAVYKESNRSDFNRVKFKTPGGAYQNLTADEILFDGYNDSDFGNYSPYACYKDVTSIISALGNPDGEYFVANVRASSGDDITGGISAGWTMVVVYENPTLPGKYITTFDGYAGVKSGESVDIPYNGFITLPPPFPVNAKMAVATLEGDNRITGDKLSIKANSNSAFTTLGNTTNPSNNFFNSNITIEDNIVTTRTPNSINTLGWDVDLFSINNPNNSVIPNDETGAVLRASSTQDKYDIFFSSFSVEVIEPDMQLAKGVFDTDGNDIQGQEVALGQEIQYTLSFDNIGNDNGTNFSIKDILPVNVDFISAQLPPSISGQQITYTHDYTTNELIFTIPDIYVEVPREDYTIKINVRVQEDCDKLRDACSNIIQNQAFATYQGVLNDNLISDDPSVSGFDTCNFGIPGSTNFLPNLDECNFEREIAICGDSVELIAGANYDTYQWFFQNPDGSYRALTGVIEGATGQTYTATNYGTYKVEKKITEPCKDYDEFITVVPRSNDLTSPFASVADQVVTCPNDGTLLPKFFLCGTNDDRMLNVSFPDAIALVWQKLDESCSATSTEDDCPTKDNSCTWNDIGTGDQYELAGPGEYRLEVRYQNNCFNRFYFKAYENSVDPTISTEDIICDTKGSIDISGVGNGYEYAIALASTTFNPNTAAWQNDPSFEVETAGTYNVYIRQVNIDIEDGDREPCLFKFENVVIANRNFSVDVTTNNPNCKDSKGSFVVNVDDARAWYTYVLRDDTGSVVDQEDTSDDNHHEFEGVDPGNYTIEVTTVDGCNFDEPYTIEEAEELILHADVTANINCDDGLVTLSVEGGSPTYSYAIWSYSPSGTATAPAISYSDISEVPGSAYNENTPTNQFPIAEGSEGIYTFLVTDSNNCNAFSNEVVVVLEPKAEFSVDKADETCFGAEDGSITVTLNNAHGYNISYSIDGVTFSGTNIFNDLTADNYTITVRATKGNVTCDYTRDITIAPGVQISAAADLTQDYTCDHDGEITFSNATGGSGTFEYSIDGINWQDNPVFGDLTAGTYTPRYRDINNLDCIRELDDITIDSLTPPTNIDFTSSAPQCPAQTSNVSLSVTGGFGTINYEIIAPASAIVDNETNNTFENIPVGATYTFRVTDEKGCFYDENLTISPITPIGVNGQLISDVSCVTGTNGEIRFNVSGFTGDYSYDITNEGGTTVDGSSNETNNTIDITGLPAGNYTITVTDNTTKCTDTDNVEVEEPVSPLALGTPDITHESCSPSGTNLGAVTITASGGWGSYTYELYDSSNNLIKSNGTGSFSGLAAGDYTIQVSDANECDITSTTITIDPAIAPELNLSANNLCYDDAVGLTITATVTPGTGAGTLSYTLNGGRTNTIGFFDELGPGTYTVTVTDEKNCTDTETITVNPELEVTASASPISACNTSTDVTITATGGDGNYVYAIVATGGTPTGFSTTTPISVTSAGDYDVYVRDHAGGAGYCEAKYDITITADPTLTVSASNTDILCNGTTSTLTITAGGGSGGYTYSIDNGVTFQLLNEFNNLIAGNYNIVIKDARGCQKTLFYTIAQPQALTASANVAALVECNPGVGADVRITNAQGGTKPYEYSFDGGSSYGSSATRNLMPGSYELYIKDASGCIFGPMPITVEEGPEDPELGASVAYNCDGTGNITVKASPSTYDYTYQLNGGTEQTENEFIGVVPGTHNITVNYISNLPATPSVLLEEDFGAGPNTSIPSIDASVYCYEDQMPGGNCGDPGDISDTRINDGEYSVTQEIAQDFGDWVDVVDHTGNTNGRFLAINIGGVAGMGGVIYRKPIKEFLPNQDVQVSIWGQNLMEASSDPNKGDPNIVIQLVDPSNDAVIAQDLTGVIPKSEQWEQSIIDLNPNGHTELDLVVRTNSTVEDGNDLAIDDILVTQIPQKCPLSKDIQVIVEDGHKFTAEIVNTTDVTCNSDNDSKITISVSNFGAGGYEYSIDNFTTVLGSSTNTTETISLGLGVGTYTLSIRDIDNKSATPALACNVDLPVTISQPDPVAVTAQITSEITCNIATATITATIATGGTPGYEYQLEDTIGNPIAGYGFATNGDNRIFSNLPIGDYVVRARDSKLCDAVSNTVSVTSPETIAFTATPIPCYAGDNNGYIDVEVTAGNDNYRISLNGGVFVDLNVDDTHHRFTGLTPGSYDIVLKDGYGCSLSLTGVIIGQELKAVVKPTAIACNSGSIDVTASGGSGSYQYAFIPSGNTVADSDFGPSNSFPVASGSAGDYDVYVRDNNGTAPYCDYMEMVEVKEFGAISITATPTQPQCHDEKGAIKVDISGGVGPYDIVINDGTTDVITKNDFPGTNTTFYNLPAANYTVTVTDNYGCDDFKTPSITNPDELTADIEPILPANCVSANPDDYGFEFQNVTSTLGTVEFSADGGLTWQSSPQFTGAGFQSGDIVYPSIRTVDGSGDTVCKTDFPRYIIPYPLDDLNITISAIVVNCNELQVDVQGTQGNPPYQYTYTETPTTFDPATASWTTPATNGNHLFTGLVPGRTYVFYVRDDAGCVRQSSKNVNDLVTLPMEITYAYEPACTGSNDAEITFTVTDTDGTVENRMRWELFDIDKNIISTSGGIVPFASPQEIEVTGLAPGEYYIEVTQVDAGGADSCYGATENILIEEQDPITGTPAKIRDIACETPGLIKVSDIAGGGGTYTYVLTSTDFDTNGDGVNDTSDEIRTTNNPMEVSIDDILDPAVGTITVDVNVIDQFECSNFLGTATLTISQPPVVNSVVVDNCEGDSTITINVTGETTDYYYSIDGGATYQAINENVFTNVATGNYDIWVKDTNGCIGTHSTSVDIFEPLELKAKVSENLDCQLGDEDAELTFEVSGGSSATVANITYTIAGPTGFSNPVTNGAIGTNPWTFAEANVPGRYTITVNDVATGCSVPVEVDVPEKIVPEPSIQGKTDVDCNGNDNGTITVSALDNGIGPFTFEIIQSYDAASGITNPLSLAPTSADSYTATFTGLAGLETGLEYTVQVTGNLDNECTETITETIYQPERLNNLGISVTQFACTSGSNTMNIATVTASGVTGGTGDYIYEFVYNNGTPGDTSDDITQKSEESVFNISNIAGGNVVVNVYDEKGCPISDNVDVLPYNKLEKLATTPINPTCNGGDGEITVDATLALGLGTEILTFEIYDDAGNIIASEGYTGNTTTHTFENLDVGNYQIKVINTGTGCELNTTEELTDPNTFDIDLDIVSSAVCFGSATGEITVELVDSTYSGTVFVYIYDSTGTVGDITTAIKSVSGASNAALTIDLFNAGAYTAEVVQDNAPYCSQTRDFTIATPPAALTATTSVTPKTCDGDDGVIEITNVSGGWGGYKYYVDTTPIPDENDITNYSDNPRFENLAIGTYEIWVIDQKGCPLKLPSEAIVEPTPLDGNISASTPNCDGLSGEITVDNVTGGSGGLYTFQLIKDGADFGSPKTGMTATFTGLGAGNYQVAISDTWNCSITLPTSVTLYEKIALTYDIDSEIACDATNNNVAGAVTINATGGSGTYTYSVAYPDGSIANNGTVASFTGLDQLGTYIFTVEDSEGCDNTIKLGLDAPVIPEIKITKKTDISCEGADDGTIKATVASATATNPPYTYILSGPVSDSNTSGLFIDLPPGSYTVRVRSALGCSDEEMVEIAEPLALDFTASVTTEFACNPDNTLAVGQITVNITAGTGTAPYLYSIDGTNYRSTNVFDVVDTGNDETYTLYVKDANGCFDTHNVSINTLPKIDAVGVTQITAITCINPEEVQVEIVGGSGDFDVTLLPSGPTQSITGQTADFDLPAPGDYVFQVTDNVTGCYFTTAPYTVNPYDFISATATANTPVSCFGSATGEIIIDVANYTGDYTYEVFGSNGTSTGVTGVGVAPGQAVASGISAGNYYVEITATDTPYCPETTNSVTIKSPTKALDITVSIAEDLSCITSEAEIVAQAIGGWGNYQYAIVTSATVPTPALYTTSKTFAGIVAGTYDIYVKDAEGCEAYETITLTQPDPISATATSTSIDVLCEGDKTGSITVTGTIGGRPDFDATVEYLYVLNRLDESGNIVSTSAPQLSNVFNNLAAGDYSVIVTDNHDCESVPLLASITEPTAVTAALRLVKSNTCTTGATIELTANGGTGSGYEYSQSLNGPWATMSGNSIRIDIAGPLASEEKHQYYVRDANQCMSNISNSVTISPVRPLEITPTVVADVSCYNEATGYIKVDVTGGLGNYLYTLMDVSGNVVVRPQQEENTFDSLPAGVYYVQVDSEDCMEQLRVEIMQGQPLTSKEPVVFNPMCSDDLGRIELELEGGTGEYQYAISPNLDQFQSKNVFEDLEPGTYTIIAQDSKGCNPYVYKREIVAPNPIAAKADILNQEYCVGDGTGSFELNIEGGTAPYSTAINTQDDNAFVQDRITFDGLAGGETYVVFVRDANGCQTNVIVTMDAPVNLDPQAQVAYTCIDNSASNEVEIILAQDGLTDVIYSMDGGPDQFENKFTNIPPGSHTVTVSYYGCQRTVDFTVDTIEPLNMAVGQSNINEFTMEASGGTPPYEYYVDGVSNGTNPTYVIRQSGVYEVKVIDANGCERIAQIEMEFVDVDVPNVFTPDGDNNNDTWTPKNTIQYPNIITKIYDRYGRVVAELRLGDEWDGRYNGTQLPTGDYWYVIKLNGDEDDREFVGHFTLYR